MARINIEDSIKSDIRFINLAIKLGSIKLALGELTWAWIEAQKYYLKAESARCIPFDVWKKQDCSNLIIEVGLAEEREFGVWIKGADQQFGWLLQKQKAGQKGGETKAQNAANAESLTSAQSLSTPKIDQDLSNISLADAKRSLENDTENVACVYPLSSYLFTLNSELKTLSSNSTTDLENKSPPSNKLLAVVEPKKANRNDLVIFENDEQLVSQIPEKTKKAWMVLYNEQGEFLRRETLKAFVYYSSNPKKQPKKMTGWIRALSSWYERAWPHFVKTIPTSVATQRIGITEEEMSAILDGRR